MKITRILAYRVELPLHEGSYKWSGGKSVTVFDSTIVARRDRRRASSATARSARSGRSICRPTPTACAPASRELGPHLLGEDPRAARRSSTAAWTPRSRAIPTSSPASTSPAGTSSARRPGMPVCELLGGRYGDDFVLYRAISQESPEAMAAQRRRLSRRGLPPLPAQGRRRSRTWTSSASAPSPRSSSPATGSSPTPTPAGCSTRPCASCEAVRDVDVYIEQPCLTYEECLAVRRHTDHPFVLDENIDRLDMLLRGQGRPGDGRGEPQDQQARRPDEDAAGPRPVRVAWASR